MKSSSKKLLAALTVSALMMGSVPELTKANESLDRRKESFSQQNKEIRSWHSTINLSKVSNRQILVKTGGDIDKLISEYGVEWVSRSKVLERNGLYVLKVPVNINYQEVLTKLKESTAVESAEPDYLQKRMDFTPNDEFYDRQWHLPKLRLPQIWGTMQPQKQVVVAVVDSGVDYNHPDLKGQLLPGYDTYEQDNDPMDDVGHGTMVAGTIAAKSNNGIGVAGINPNAKILPVRVGGENGAATSDSVKGVLYAIENGADVINLSYGSPYGSDIEYETMLKAYQKGIVVIAASGNERKQVSYPASYPTVISVGSTNSNDRISSFSNYGYRLDLTAPGEGIGTTWIGGEYGPADGTSFSAPVVSGLASLIKSTKPQATPEQIEYMLEKGSKVLARKPYIWNQNAGYGRVDAVGAFNAAFPNMRLDAPNTREKAQALSLNKKYSNKFELPLDDDWYVIKVAKNMQIKVELGGVANIDSNIWIDKKYASGKVTGERQIDGKGMGGKETFIFNATPGSYYLQIYEVYNHWSPQPYSLKITQVDTVAPAAPKVRAVDSNDRAITGTAERGATVLLKTNRVVGKAKVTSRGTFSIPIQPQKKGTTFTVVAVDAAGNTSKGTKLTVR